MPLRSAEFSLSNAHGFPPGSSFRAISVFRFRFSFSLPPRSVRPCCAKHVGSFPTDPTPPTTHILIPQIVKFSVVCRRACAAEMGCARLPQCCNPSPVQRAARPSSLSLSLSLFTVTPRKSHRLSYLLRYVAYLHCAAFVITPWPSRSDHGDDSSSSNNSSSTPPRRAVPVRRWCSNRVRALSPLPSLPPLLFAQSKFSFLPRALRFAATATEALLLQQRAAVSGCRSDSAAVVASSLASERSRVTPLDDHANKKQPMQPRSSPKRFLPVGMAPVETACCLLPSARAAHLARRARACVLGAVSLSQIR